MAQKNLVHRLLKDLRRSPKKTAVLALLAVVAIWFWAPLIWKWVVPEQPSYCEAQSEDAPVTAVATSQTTIPPSETASPNVYWRNLAELYQSRQLLAAREWADEIRDPFIIPSVPAEKDTEDEAQTEAEATTTKTLPPTPAELGLVVRSTITGRGVGWAQINGRLCRVGTVLVAPHADGYLEFEITDIAPGSVSLSRGDEVFKLEHAERSGGMKVTQATDRLPILDNQSGRVVIEPVSRN